MICPYCDSRVKDLPDNHVCPHCGAPLGKNCDTEQREDEYRLRKETEESLIGRYNQTMGYMEIGESSVEFRKEQFVGEDTVAVIPYSEIAAVYMKPSGRIDGGFLCVRDRQNQHIPSPKTTWKAAGDCTSVLFCFSENEKYTKIYQFFKQCADRNNKAKGA